MTAPHLPATIPLVASTRDGIGFRRFMQVVQAAVVLWMLIEVLISRQASGMEKAAAVIAAVLAVALYAYALGRSSPPAGQVVAIEVHPDRLTLLLSRSTRVRLPIELIDFAAVDTPSETYEKMGLRIPPRFPVAWLQTNASRALMGQVLAPTDRFNLAIVFRAPTRFDDTNRPRGLLRDVRALFGNVADPTEAADALAEVITVRDLEAADLGKLFPMTRLQQVFLVTRDIIKALALLVITLSPMFVLMMLSARYEA